MASKTDGFLLNFLRLHLDLRKDTNVNKQQKFYWLKFGSHSFIRNSVSL